MWVQKWNDVQRDGSLLDSLILTGGMTATLLHFLGCLCICFPTRGLHQHHLGVVRNAESQAPPQLSHNLHLSTPWETSMHVKVSGATFSGPS